MNVQNETSEFDDYLISLCRQKWQRIECSPELQHITVYRQCILQRI